MAARFITYSTLEDLRDTRKRSQINGYVNSARREHKIRASKKASRPLLEWQFRPPSPLLVKVEPEDLQGELPWQKRGRDADDEVDDEAVQPLPFWKPEAFSTPRSSVDVHRRDPFASMPVTQTGQVLWAADYFTQVYAQENASLYSDDRGNWLLRRFFPLALQSDMLFEAIILSMSRLHPASLSAIVPGGINFAFYRTSVIAKLHRRLAKEDEATDDITVHTIMCLISADFFAGHDEHAATHLKGLQAIVSSRGGLERGGFDRFTIYNLTGVHALCQFASQRLQQSSAPPVRPQVKLTYPKHPYSPNLCTIISTLPLGFSDIAIDGRLSIQIIKLLARLARAAQDSPLTKNATVTEINRMGVDFLSYIAQGDIAPLERSICVLCFMFNIRDGLQSTRNKGQQLFGDFLGNLKSLLRSTAETFMALDGCTVDLAIWGVGILATVTTVEGLGLSEEERSDALARLVRRYPRVAKYWDETKVRLQRFFFPDEWVDEYHVWWTKEMMKHAF